MEKMYFTFQVSGEFLDVRMAAHFGDADYSEPEARRVIVDASFDLIKALHAIGILLSDFADYNENENVLNRNLEFGIDDYAERFLSYDEAMDFFSEYLWQNIPRSARRYIIGE